MSKNPRWNKPLTPAEARKIWEEDKLRALTTSGGRAMNTKEAKAEIDRMERENNELKARNILLTKCLNSIRWTLEKHLGEMEQRVKAKAGR